MIILWIVIGLIFFFGFVVFFGAPYVPSHRRDVYRALTELYPLGKSDTLIDIGAGDGRVLRIASTQGARAIGYEIQPVLYGVARVLSSKDDRVQVRLANFWQAKLPLATTVVYAFSVHRDQIKLVKKLQAFADTQQKTVALISYGNPLVQIVDKQVGAHFLYRITPRQKKALTV